MRQSTRRRRRSSLTGYAAAAAAAVLAVCGSGSASAATPGNVTAGGTTVGARAGAGAPGQADVLSAPTLVAHSVLGDVGYREVGEGSPILLVMGYGGSMDDWAPSFVDALAAHHRVIVFDNAGVGRTSALPAPLTVSAMADQTSALISSLRLHRPAVLGWSMGGMIAQALAVRHPGQVGRLVLTATQAGTGRSLPVPPAAAAALNSPIPAVELSVLFPGDQTAAARAYAGGILQYPNFYRASDVVKNAQTGAVQQWMAGAEPAGRQVGRIRTPILVADGTLDALDPTANDVILTHSLRRAGLALYPDAGHAFLFQDAAEFVPAVDRFVS
ncbi:alpha/beta fold hydrolase [Kitasatospora sp. NPDC052896]|uniref:alpha/beta fold hydrolase n=1 Tax=Kitasatospora sp. NPDC052896 TaxID=3364061 RepID=UPI0037CCC065